MGLEEDLENEHDDDDNNEDDSSVICYHRLTEEGLVNLWEVFLREYKNPQKDEALAARKVSTDYEAHYMNVINDFMRNGKKTIVVDFEDLTRAVDFHGLKDKDGTSIHVLVEMLQSQQSRECIDLLVTATLKILREMHPDFGSEKEIVDYMRGSIIHTPRHKEISEIDHTDEGRIIQVEAFLNSVSIRRPLDLKVVYTCLTSQCQHVVETFGNFYHKTPRMCRVCLQKSTFERDNTPFNPRALKITYEEMFVQERESRKDRSRIVQPFRVIAIGQDLLDKAAPGDYVILTGVVKVDYEENLKVASSKGNFYLELLSIEKQQDEYFVRDEISHLEEKVKSFIDPIDEESGFEKFCRSVATSVQGHDIVKKALLLVVAGCDPILLDDGTRYRGDPGLGLFGPPSTAKSRLAVAVSKILPRSIIITGELTQVGLTAAIVKEEKGTPTLHAGAYLRASSEMGGLVVIDEIEKLKPVEVLNPLTSILSDEQMFSVNKYGMSKEFKNIHVSTIAMGNPLKGKDWDDSKSLEENTGLPNWLPDRFDANFIFRDEPSKEQDKLIIRHMLRQMQLGVTEAEVNQVIKDSGRSMENVDKVRITHEIMERKKKIFEKKMREKGWSLGEFEDSINTHSVEEMRVAAVYMRTHFHPTFDFFSPEAEDLMQFYLTKRQEFGDVKELVKRAKLGDTEAYNELTDVERDDAINKMMPPKINPRGFISLVKWALASARAHYRNHVTRVDCAISKEVVLVGMQNEAYNPLMDMEMSREVKRRKEEERQRQTEERRYQKGRSTVAKIEADMKADTEKAIADQTRALSRQIAGELRHFQRAIQSIGFTLCQKCGGTGNWYPRANVSVERCPDCLGNGGMFDSFLRNDLRIKLGTRVQMNHFDTIFEHYAEHGKIKPSSHGYDNWLATVIETAVDPADVMALTNKLSGGHVSAMLQAAKEKDREGGGDILDERPPPRPGSAEVELDYQKMLEDLERAQTLKEDFTGEP